MAALYGGRRVVAGAPFDARRPLVGREQELATAEELLLERGVRLLTLTGPPGVGKTTLALAIAEHLDEELTDGSVFVDLAPVVDPELVIVTIADAVGARAPTNQPPEERLRTYLEGRDLLLILDNFEQVLAAAPRIGGLLETCPDLCLIVTSRAPLRLRAEHEVPVAPLGLPDLHGRTEVEIVASAPAVTLIVERAQAVHPAFALDQRNARATAELCVRLDGLPLAIELAAARVRLLSPDVIAQRLATSERPATGPDNPPHPTRTGSALNVLSGGPRDWPERHQTLGKAIHWSYGLLDPAEQRLFRRVAIFSGGCTVDAVEAVCEASWDLIESLAEKSLIRIESPAGAEPRLRLLELVRQYALEELEASNEIDEVGSRHTAYFLQLAERAEPELVGADQELWLDRLAHENANIRAAARRAAQRGDGETVLRLGAALWRFWWARSDAAEARERVQSILSLAEGMPPSPARSKALHGAGVLARELGEYDNARRLFQESLAVARLLDDRGGVARALHALGWLAVLQEDLAGARPYLDESLAVARSLGDGRGIAMALHGLGYATFLADRQAEARALYEESLRVARSVNDRRIVADVLFSIGTTYHMEHEPKVGGRYYVEAEAIYRTFGDRHALAMLHNLRGLAMVMLGEIASARALYRSSLLGAREAGNRRRLLFVLEAVAALAAACGEPERAVRLDEAANAAGEIVGAALPRVVQALHATDLGQARETLGPSITVAARAIGRAMTLDQAVDEALGWLERGQDAASVGRAIASAAPGAGGDPAAGPARSGDGEPGSTPPPGAQDQAVPLLAPSATAGAGGPLTRRELEVARLLGRGLTNRQIADALVITPGTASNYVQRVLDRLGFHTRAQVAAWAVERGLARAPERDSAPES